MWLQLSARTWGSAFSLLPADDNGGGCFIGAAPFPPEFLYNILKIATSHAQVDNCKYDTDIMLQNISFFLKRVGVWGREKPLFP